MSELIVPAPFIKKEFQPSSIDQFKAKALSWAQRFHYICLLENNAHTTDPYHKANAILALSNETAVINFEGKDAFNELKAYCKKQHGHLFGHFSYDLKNDVENLSSDNFDNIKFPAIQFFEAEIIIEFSTSSVNISANDPEEIYNQIVNFKTYPQSFPHDVNIQLTPRMAKEEYLEKITTIRQHILEGDVYEMNFCQEFFNDNCTINPLALFQKLNQNTKEPFSAFYKVNDKYLLCSSPERFMQKTGNQLISQPIKGTIKKGKTAAENEVLKSSLRQSKKDQAENVMIVDLVRNDLSKSCEAGSVKVPELFGIHSFSHVHHMVSTITGKLRNEVHFVDAIKAAFPMGSMTGAPKVMAMELIEKYEKTKRGLYAGAVGYIRPNGDFDFNVVIRSILYNKSEKYLSYQVGGAIVYDSDPMQEYEECLLKAEGILKALK